jgi:hypothetical protein
MDGVPMSGTQAHQVFIGPTTLGIYKTFAISGGVQFPVYHSVGSSAEGARSHSDQHHLFPFPTWATLRSPHENSDDSGIGIHTAGNLFTGRVQTG